MEAPHRSEARGSVGDAENIIPDTAYLAAHINSYHEAARRHRASEAENARAAGELLLIAKETCAHGNWLSWLEHNFVGSVRTAQRYMRIFERWQKIIEAAKTTHVTHLSVNEALEFARSGQQRKYQAETLKDKGSA